MFLFGFVALRRDDGDGVFSQKGFAKDEVASGGDGEALREGINVGHMMEKFTEFEAATTENVDIRLAVAKNVGLEVKDKLLTLNIIVPRIEFLAIVWIHTVGVIVHGSWKGSHIVLVLCTVKEVGNAAFFQLCKAEGLGEIRQTHGNKTERIDKFDVQLCYGEGKDLCATSNHFGSNAILVEILEDKVPMVSLEIMGDEGRAGVLFLEDPLTGLVFGTVPRKHKLVAAFVLDHAMVRDVLPSSWVHSKSNNMRLCSRSMVSSTSLSTATTSSRNSLFVSSRARRSFLASIGCM